MTDAIGTKPQRQNSTPSRGAGGRVTIRTVAEDAGVSVSAVSKVLRNAYGVSDALRSKVNSSIEKLEYRPSASARGMRGQSFTLGVLLTDIRNPFFAEIIGGINETLSSTPYQPLLGVSQLRARLERPLINAMMDRQMDGLIFVAPLMPLPEIKRVAKATPSVVIGLHPTDADLFDTVNGDDVMGGELVVDHLVAMGRRNIAFLSLTHPGEDNTVMLHRERGYLNALQRHGRADTAQVFRGSHQDDFEKLFDDILNAQPRCDALFCWGDDWAMKALSTISRRGLRVPEDIAVVGYDNNYLCDLHQNSLTSVEQDGWRLGKEAARLLIERIEGRADAKHVVVSPELVARRSSGSQD